MPRLRPYHRPGAPKAGKMTNAKICDEWIQVGWIREQDRVAVEQLAKGAEEDLVVKMRDAYVKSGFCVVKVRKTANGQKQSGTVVSNLKGQVSTIRASIGLPGLPRARSDVDVESNIEEELEADVRAAAEVEAEVEADAEANAGVAAPPVEVRDALTLLFEQQRLARHV
uniref:Uncharacterized protein n=1 Tax=Branchiostoma floridae TaxID=7739 RepID=C3YK77_BRAFL|eukprot:XP_002603523.1 hypothetical protein BRAFLDRAFT_79058 [Branchiostoma floridae]